MAILITKTELHAALAAWIAEGREKTGRPPGGDSPAAVVAAEWAETLWAKLTAKAQPPARHPADGAR